MTGMTILNVRTQNGFQPVTVNCQITGDIYQAQDASGRKFQIVEKPFIDGRMMWIERF